MDEQRITFAGGAGQSLVGRYHPARGLTRATALFAHCFTCSKDLRAAKRISETLAERGIASLRFDFTGLGESAGEFSDSTFSTDVDDLIAATAWLRGRGTPPDLLVGHSLGGAAVLAAAESIPEARAIVTIGAPCEPSHVKKLFAANSNRIAAEGEAEIELAGRRFRVKQSFIDDLDQQAMQARIATLRRALLVMHAPLDDVVGVDNARCLFETAKHPKSFVSLDGADHLLSRPADARYAAEVAAAWLSRYVNDLSSDAPAATRLDSGTVEVSGGPSGFANVVRVGQHRFAADEPTDVPGGTDTGPAPYDLLLAGLGACTSMTLRMYADRKGWPLDSVRVELHHAKVHADDCAECETKVGKVDLIERVIEMHGALDDSQRARLLEIADKCPVHRTLSAEIQIRTRATASQN